MNAKNKDKKKHSNSLPKVIRWIARIWSLLALADAFVLVFSMGSDQVLKDWPILALWGLAIVGLLIAWQYEVFGASIALVLVVVHDLLYLLLKGTWLKGFMIMWAFIIPPAILFLVAWQLDRMRKAKKKAKKKK